MEPYTFDALNDTCYILPRAKIPNGLILNYETCPENFDNTTLKLVKYCCFFIIYGITQKSNYIKVQNFLRDYSSSLLVIPSVLFNILALIVLNRFNRLKNYSQTSTTFYMKSICFLDTLTIVSKFLHEIIVVRNAVRTNPIFINSYMCKFLFFFESLCSISAIFLLITMSIDKLICVLKPLKANQILSSFKAKIIVFIIILISASISSYELITQTAVELPIPIIEESKINITNNKSINNNNNNFIRYDCDSQWPENYEYWILFNHGIKVFLPIIMICFCNSWIVIELARKTRFTNNLFKNEFLDSKRKNISYSSEINDNNNQLDDENKIVNRKFDIVSLHSSNRNNTIELRKSNHWTSINLKRKNTTQHISIMLFAVSFGFVNIILFIKLNL
jgi:hypothetical protein